MKRNDRRREETKGTEEVLDSLFHVIHWSQFLVHHEDYPHILQQYDAGCKEKFVKT
jgi:hypothetical protein